MKNHDSLFRSGVVLLFLLVLILGCGGGPSTSGGSSSTGTTDNGVVQFNMDGADWISGPPGHPELQHEEEAITDGSTMVRIEAFAANGSHLALAIFNAAGIGPGSYPVKESGMSGFFKDDFNDGGGYLTGGMKDNPGVITISSMTDEQVVGTFAFPVRNSGDP